MCDISKQLIQYCSPTLAGLKVAGLFGYFFTSELVLTNNLAFANKVLNPKGIYAVILRIKSNTALIYVYRKSKLTDKLEKVDVKNFLKACEYRSNNVDAYIEKLRRRLSQHQNFPHEIGVFLGYPLHDVLGFIMLGGQNCKCSGCWKVYSMESEALKLFARFNKCKEVYTKLFSQGRPIERLRNCRKTTCTKLFYKRRRTAVACKIKCN